MVLEQQATATDGGAVWQAGRDIITGNVFTGSFARLIDAWIPPDAVFDEAQISQFTGREWLIDRIDRFIRRHDRGYVVIQAPAGIGKTALAAWLAAERGWPCHFTRRRKGNVAATALRNLAAQIIAGYQLSDRFTPGGMLPETAGEPGWFDQVLRAGAAAATAAGQKLVVVVDGLDEAETFDGDLPLGLPTRLPRGVIMVVTCRTGSRLLGMRLPWEKTTFELADERNLADMRHFLERTAGGDGEIAGRLATAGVTTGDFVAGLLDRSGGVWVYLRYILDALRLDLHSPLEIDQLPPDLITYYTEQLLPDDDEDTTRTRLLVTLAAVTEPLPVTVLAELAGLPESDVERLCSEPLRPFLTCTTVGDDRRYAIYHVSLRDYLHGAYLDSMLEADQARAGRLARRCRAAHSRIADHYLRSWGGLHAGLPGLAADPGIAARHGGYPLRNLVLHLDRAQRDDDLHRLLATDDGARNLWYAAHDHAGTLVDYVTDLRRAQRLVAAEVDADVRATRPATGFGLELRYTMMQAATVSLTNNIPPALAATLVEHGMWSVERALGHARRFRVPILRCELLSRLLPHLPPAERDAVAAEAIRSVEAIDPAGRAWAHVNVVSHHPAPVPEAFVSAAVDAAVAADDDELLAEALAELAPNLGAQSGRAITLSATLMPEGRRVWVWRWLLPYLGREQVEAVLGLSRMLTDETERGLVIEAAGALDRPPPAADLLDLARSLGAAGVRAVALTIGVPLLAAADRPAVLAEALEAARACADPADRAWALGQTAAVSPGEQRSALLGEALAVAASVPDPVDRVRVTTGMVEHLDAARVPEILAELLDLVDSVSAGPGRAVMLGHLTEVADDRTAELIIERAGAVAEGRAREELLTDWAHACQERHLARVLRCVRDRLDVVDRVEPLKVLARRAAPALTTEILEEVARLPSAYRRFDVLTWLAPGLPAGLFGAAMDMVTAISDEEGRAQLLTVLAESVPEQRSALVREAVGAARGLAGPGRAKALTRIAVNVREPERSRLLDEALSDAQRVSRPWQRFVALVAVAEHLDGLSRDRAVTMALAAARDSDFANPRSFALSEIARLRPADAPELLKEAVAAAREHPDPVERPPLLAQVAGRMPAGPERGALLREAIAQVGDGGSWQRRITRVALRIVDLLPEPTVIACLAAVESFINERDLPDILLQVVRRLPEPLITEAVEAGMSISARMPVEIVVGQFVPYLPGKPREIALRHLLSVAFAGPARQGVLREGARAWPARLGPGELDIVRRCLDGTDLDDCFAVLASAGDLLERIAGPRAHREVLDEVRLVQRWWPGSAG
ncbi:hypothetical protein Aph02nite_28610 [Actinoplanes philippinensis]|uniref:AAA ATPase domain-containing protein n=1 Tax=Actinoplanes philippinensis TaxID=35752 RepID=A0A1I2GEF8_9ACTN|nr:hypothetical protein [Actinoplanes philippinensis]GIE76911.1 hypothetical protein Aph02nite_28610 [Actinoplanes philippinensis]SFF16164.1 hypothetical protein SAMN05421541_106515 [Actinoplanes philippinensis]